MFYEAELDIFRAVLKKCRINTMLINSVGTIEDPIGDFGKELLTKRDVVFLQSYSQNFKGNTIYKLTDSLSLSFVFMVLPGDVESDEKKILVVGPYSQREMTDKTISEISRKYTGDKSRREIENLLLSVPYVQVGSHIYAMLETLAERIWGEGNFSTVDLNYEMSGGFSPIQIRRDPTDQEKATLNMKIMEQRYAFENELMQAVAQGQLQKTELIMSTFSSMHFEERTADPVRNAKNYSIIMNTLLRKAAESGGVHPVYLDSISSGFAFKIEALTTLAEAEELMGEMFRSYCRLVRKHSMKNYSPPIQKVIATIDFDLTANLTLSALATMQNISPSYLSALFKQEVGETLTEYVNGKRIKRAMQLLETTKMQVQTIAQNCGILDVHYFSKIFKKTTGMTPKEYRESFFER
ncbi:MAG: helix-turn-helix domain-containing protein [Ruminococcaceae bacterium]|nr:helix-turn-helix domain-containing protein [Oscillospiraceae bacterium]